MRRRRNDGKGVRNCDRTEGGKRERERGRKKEKRRATRGAEGVCQESLCNRSFLLFPEVVGRRVRTESLGEVNLDSRWMGGVDGATRTVEGERGRG